jgi:hypothetical protein
LIVQNLGENLLIITIISVYSESQKAEFFRRYAHCSTLLSRIGKESGDLESACFKYLKTGDASPMMPHMQRMGIATISDIETIFESASTYTTIERDILDKENPYSSTGYVTGKGYYLFALFHNMDLNSREAQVYIGTKNNPIHWHKFSTEVVGNPAFGGLQKTREDYIKYLRLHCKKFLALMKNKTGENPVGIKFSIEELLDFPIPIF